MQVLDFYKEAMVYLLRKKKLTQKKVADAIGVAILMGGGPGMLYAAHAIKALEQFSETER